MKHSHTSSTRPRGDSSFNSRSLRFTETYISTIMLTPELSMCDKLTRFSNNLRLPVAVKSRSCLLNSLTPASMVGLPRRSNILTSPHSALRFEVPQYHFFSDVSVGYFVLQPNKRMNPNHQTSCKMSVSNSKQSSTADKSFANHSVTVTARNTSYF